MGAHAQLLLETVCMFDKHIIRNAIQYVAIVYIVKQNVHVK